MRLPPRPGISRVNATAERERVRSELAQADRFTEPGDVDEGAERIVDSLWHLGEGLDHAEPAILREVLQQSVARIVCR